MAKADGPVNTPVATMTLLFSRLFHFFLLYLRSDRFATPKNMKKCKRIKHLACVFEQSFQAKVLEK
jgi:hypothetical protein